jgi:hypothetical protein
MIDRLTLVTLARAAALAALLLAAPAAGAAPSDDDATSLRIADLYKRANVLYAEKDLAHAEALYLEAWKLKKTYDVACNLGAVELDLHKPKDAAPYLAFALREFPAGEKPAAREQIKARLAMARAQVVTLRVHMSMTGATLAIDGVPVAPDDTGPELFVNPGAHTVSATADGYTTAQATVDAAPGASRDVALTLVPVPPPKRSVVPGAVLGGVAGAALVTGIGLTAAAFGKRSTVRSLNQQIVQAGGSCVANAPNFSPTCSTLESTSSTGDALGRAGVGLFVGAGALTIASAAYFLWPSPKAGTPSTGQVRVVPAVSADGGGVLFSGAF